MSYIKVKYEVFNTLYNINKKLRELNKLTILGFDVETRSTYTQEEVKEAKDLLKHPELIEPEHLINIKQVARSSGLSHPSIIVTTHFIFGLSEDESVILIAQDPRVEKAIWEWVVRYKGKLIVHNSGFDLKICPLCKGAGNENIKQGFFHISRTCSRCAGRQKIMSRICNDCGGKGYGQSVNKIKLEVPAGVVSGSKLRFGGAAGAEIDLILERGIERIGIEFKTSTAPKVTRGFWSSKDDLELVHSFVVCPIDEIYDLTYERDLHPYYKKIGNVRALDTIRFSIPSHRGCYGECNFCSIAVH